MEPGAKSGLIAGFLSACLLALLSATYMVLGREAVLADLESQLTRLGVQFSGLHQLYGLLVAGVIVGLVAAVSLLGLLLGALYAKIYGVKENRVKAVGVALLFFIVLELLFNIPLPPGLVHPAFAMAAALYGGSLYVAYGRLDVAGLLEGLDHLELKLVEELSRGRFRLRELEGRVGEGVEALLPRLTRLEERGLVELDLDKRYGLTELGRLVVVKCLRRGRAYS